MYAVYLPFSISWYGPQPHVKLCGTRPGDRHSPQILFQQTNFVNALFNWVLTWQSLKSLLKSLLPT